MAGSSGGILIVQWLDPHDLEPPHQVVRWEQVDELADAFRKSGWDRTKPALRGYYDVLNGKVQLLSGTHRQAGAERAGIRVPVIVWPWAFVREAWGTPAWDKVMGIGQFREDECGKY